MVFATAIVILAFGLLYLAVSIEERHLHSAAKIAVGKSLSKRLPF